MAQRDNNERIAVERTRTGGSGWIWILGAIALVAIALFLLIPLFNNNDSAGLDQGATISEIVQAPNNYTGKTVTVSGAVNDVLGARAFTLGGDELYGDAQLLVVSRNMVQAPEGRSAEEALASRDVVQVTGPVRLFNLADVEKELGADLDDAAFAPYAGRPAVIAQSVDLTPYMGQAASNEGFADITLDEITQDLAAYAGQRVVVSGGINVVLNNRAFTIADNTLLDTNEVLVINATDKDLARAVVAEEPVIVMGNVRLFNLAEVEQEVGYDLQDDLFADFEGKPMIVARNVSMFRDAPTASANGAIQNASVADIAGNPEALKDQRVAVQATVESVIGSNAFSLDEDAVLEGGIDNDVLVISANQQNDLINDALGERQVVVVGPVRMFNITEIENELGYDLDDNLFTDWQGGPAIVAEAIRPLEPAQAAAPVAPAVPDAGLFGTVTGDQALNVGLVPGAQTLTVAEIAGNLDQFTGQQVAVRSEVEEVITPYAFTLDEDALLEGGIDNDLLVIGANQNNSLIDEGLGERTVLVQGTVRPFDLATFEQELGYDLEDSLLTDWAGRPAIIASDIRALNMDANTLAPNVGLSGDVANVTVAEIASNPTQFVGQTAAVSGEVEEVIGPTAFKIDEDAVFAGGIDNDLLVVAAGQNIPFINEELGDRTVLAVGPVREFNLAAVEQEIGYDLDDNLFNDWAGRPVIVAKAIYVAE